MSELTITTFLTLDGVMQAPGGPNEDRDGGFEHGGWVAPLFDEETGEIMLDIFRNADAFLLGRRTYDIFSAYWPKVPADPADPISNGLNTLPKHVASRTQSSFTWARSEPVRDVPTEVAALKARYPRELQVHGSSGLAQTLIAHDLIDEYRLLTFPVVVGTGKRLFGSGARPASLRLVRSSRTANGIVVDVYRKAGPLVTATVPGPEIGSGP